MANLVIINASPRPEGNSSFVARRLFEAYESDGAKLIELSKINMKLCISCRKCKENDGLCIIKDDVQTIYDDLLAADKIVFISPNHFGFLSSLGKVFLDRWYCLSNKNKKSRFGDDKKAFFIFIQGSSSREHGERALEWASGFFKAYGLKYLGFLVPACRYDNQDMVKMKFDEIKMNVSMF